MLAVLALLPLPAAAQMEANFSSGGAVRIGQSTTTCNAAASGAIRYNSTGSGAMEFCNSTSWLPMAQIQNTSGPTAPSGSGYFVLTDTTWNGNLGGLSGADSKCLTELGTTHTNWRGYSTANSNGQITAGKVQAFLCNAATCNNLMPLTTYYLAYASGGTPGGASFTTDATGLGPNDSNAWSAANYFSGSYTYWMGRQDDPGGGVTPTKWVNAIASSNDNYNCSSWSDSASGNTATTGNSSNTTNYRWWNATPSCNNTYRLICFVNP